MTENTQLLDIQATLTKYFSYFKHDNILTVSEDKASLPFIHFIYDDSYPDCILLSIAVDYPTAINVAEIVLFSNSVVPILLGEPFYISKTDGGTSFGDEAYIKWDNDSFDLKEIEPASSAVH